MKCEKISEFFAYFICLFLISNSHTSGIFYIFAIKHGYNSLRNLYIQNISPWSIFPFWCPRPCMLACFPLCAHVLDGVEPPLPHLVSQKNILCFGLGDAALSESCPPGLQSPGPHCRGGSGGSECQRDGTCAHLLGSPSLYSDVMPRPWAARLVLRSPAPQWQEGRHQ